MNPRFAMLQAGDWSRCYFQIPDCDCRCEEHEEGGFCDCEGDPPEPLTMLEPGGKCETKWKGEFLEIDSDYLLYNPCYWTKPLQSGNYRASVEAFDDYECESSGECGPDENGKVHYADPTGQSQVYEKEFELPYAEDKLTIILD
jgi:hypothetical protein